MARRKQNRTKGKKISETKSFSELVKRLTKPCKVVLVYDDFRVKKSKKASVKNQLQRAYKYEIGQQVFAKIRGFASWPGKVIAVDIGNGKKLTIVFYGDNTYADVFPSAVVPFEIGLTTFVEGKRPLLDKAVKEALYQKHQITTRSKN